MDFIFVCPKFQRTFESDAFKLTQNHGIKIDSAGQKYLDAKIILLDPCPFCGKKHSFAAKDLVCPFNAHSKGA
jgi:hypothetical protein